MVGFMLAALGAAWSVAAIDIVIESTLNSSAAFVLFGRVLVTTTPNVETFAVVGLGMSVAAIITAAITGYRRRRDEAILRTDVDRRWEEISTRNAGMEARNELLEWRLKELQGQVDALVARRDELVAQEQRDVEEAKGEVRATRSRGMMRQLRDGLIVLPDLDPDAEGAAIEAETATTGAAPTPEPPGEGTVTRFPA
jgi:hypothetical protein